MGPKSRKCASCGIAETSQLKLQICLDDDLRCNKCKTERWPNSGGPSPGRMNKEKAALKEMRTGDLQSLQDSLQFISDQVTRLNLKMDGSDKKMNDLLQEIASPKSEVKQKDQIIAELCEKVDVLEQKDKAKKFVGKGIKTPILQYGNL